MELVRRRMKGERMINMFILFRGHSVTEDTSANLEQFVNNKLYVIYEEMEILSYYFLVYEVAVHS